MRVLIFQVVVMMATLPLSVFAQDTAPKQEQAPAAAPAPAQQSPAAAPQAPPAPGQEQTTIGLRGAPPEPPPPPPPPAYYEQTYDADHPPEVYYGDPWMPERTGQVSIYLGLPMFLSSTGDALTTGFSFEGRFGLDLGYLVPELGFGSQINWFDDSTLRDDGSLSSWWLSLGLRLQWLNRSMFTPFGSFAFDMNWWHLSGDRSFACDYYYCGTVNNYRFAPGLSGRVGVAIQVHPAFGLDLGLRLAMSFPGSMFDKAESWLSPFFGGTFYF
ncbi:MAG: hypothetical protein IPJ88_17870 [Myxococcales bacterium]|nr:MAG: hypothetical protein IPJ88_17870 [Myxococcales bacterium]